MIEKIFQKIIHFVEKHPVVMTTKEITRWHMKLCKVKGIQVNNNTQTIFKEGGFIIYGKNNLQVNLKKLENSADKYLVQIVAF